jgi:hypothetical protein
VTAAYRPHSDWAREDRERKPLDTVTQARVTAASDEALVCMLNDPETGHHPELVDALIDEAAARWYVSTARVAS